MGKRETKDDFAKWKAALDARHAEYQRQADELDAKVGAELDAKYPPEQGYKRVGRVVLRVKKPEAELPTIGEYI